MNGLTVVLTETLDQQMIHYPPNPVSEALTPM